MIIAILACEENGGIGNILGLPWPLNETDMKFFRDTTIGDGNNVVVMGGETKSSLHQHFPLKNRVNLVLTRKPATEDYHINTLYEIDDYIPEGGDAFIIGGGQIYKKVFEEGFVDEILITRIPGEHRCDTFIDYNSIEEKYEMYSLQNIHNVHYGENGKLDDDMWVEHWRLK